MDPEAVFGGPDSPFELDEESLEQSLPAAELDRRAVAGRFKAWGDMEQDPPPRRWLVQDWLPAGRVSLMPGRADIGKSRLVLQLALGVANGGRRANTREWLPGAPVLPLGDAVADGGSPVVLGTWEDEYDEIARRVNQIRRDAPGFDPGRAGRNFITADLAGLGPIWGPQDGRHILTGADFTAAGTTFLDECAARQARLLILDPSAAAFAADENSRAHVRAFVSAMDDWGKSRDCAVLIVAHPAKTGSEKFSGSTDWRGAVRTMIVLEWHEPKTGEEWLGHWCLELEKGNYSSLAAAGRRNELSWLADSNGVRWQAEQGCPAFAGAAAAGGGNGYRGGYSFA